MNQKVIRFFEMTMQNGKSLGEKKKFHLILVNWNQLEILKSNKINVSEFDFIRICFFVLNPQNLLTRSNQIDKVIKVYFPFPPKYTDDKIYRL